MKRSLQAVAAAILLSQPGMGAGRAHTYAKVVVQEAVEHDFDPYTLVSMVHFESRWRQSVSNGPCLGLAGVCLTNYPACRSEPQGRVCADKRRLLLEGTSNLRVAASLITANRKFCKAKTGSALFRHWLASYQGLNRLEHGVYCGQKKVRGRWKDVATHRLTKRVIQRRLWLVKHVH